MLHCQAPASGTPSVLITGTSSGIGHATAELFAQHGWHVIAGSRTPECCVFMTDAIERVLLDVGDTASIDACFDALEQRSVVLRCVVNNAGYGLSLPLESTASVKIERMFRVNVFGLVHVCRRAYVHMQPLGGGTIINVSSIVGRIGWPCYSVYAGTKWAVEGFTESLLQEWASSPVRVKLVEPGRVATRFFERAYANQNDRTLSESTGHRYVRWKEAALEGVRRHIPPERVATVIYRAATDGRRRLRYPVGMRASALLALIRILPDRTGLWLLRTMFLW